MVKPVSRSADCQSLCGESVCSCSFYIAFTYFTWNLASLARIIVYSMAPDATPLPLSNAPTPMFSPLPSGVNTPQINDGKLGDFLAAPLGHQESTAYLAGCRALDSLARMIASTESFFHPSNSGSWTADVCIDSVLDGYLSKLITTFQLSAFLKYIVYDFNKRKRASLLTLCH
jgi:proteasome activator subunit 4